MELLAACAQRWTRSLAAVAVAAFFLCRRALSTPACIGRVTAVAARVTFSDGSERDLGRAGLLAPVEWAQRFLAGSAVAAALARVAAL